MGDLRLTGVENKRLICIKKKSSIEAACRRDIMSYCPINTYKWSTLSLYKVATALSGALSPWCRAHLEMVAYLWILLLLFLSPPVESTISTCPTKDPVLMVLKSSDESIGALWNMESYVDLTPPQFWSLQITQVSIQHMLALGGFSHFTEKGSR